MFGYDNYLTFKLDMVRGSCYKRRWYKRHESYIRVLELGNKCRSIYDFPFYPNRTEAFWGLIQADLFDDYINQNITIKNLVYGVNYVWVNPLLHRFIISSTNIL